MHPYMLQSQCFHFQGGWHRAATGHAHGGRCGYPAQALVEALEVEASILNIDGVTIRLTSGMALSAEIKTGKRRLVDERWVLITR